MSTDEGMQASLDAYDDPATETDDGSDQSTVNLGDHDGSPYRGAWDTDEQAHDETQYRCNPTHCQHCDTPVPIRVRRVLGDNDDVVWCCSQCTDSVVELRHGASDPEWEPGKCRKQANVSMSGISGPIGGSDA